MKAVKLGLCMLLALTIMACATPQQRNYTDREPGLKEKYVHAVNREAQTRATRVYWVNYPTNEEVATRYGIDADKDGS